MFVREIKNSEELKARIENDKFLKTVNSELIQTGEALKGKYGASIWKQEKKPPRPDSHLPAELTAQGV